MRCFFIDKSIRYLWTVRSSPIEFYAWWSIRAASSRTCYKNTPLIMKYREVSSHMKLLIFVFAVLFPGSKYGLPFSPHHSTYAAPFRRWDRNFAQTSSSPKQSCQLRRLAFLSSLISRLSPRRGYLIPHPALISNNALKLSVIQHLAII